MAQANKELSLKAAELARSAPMQWREFMKAFSSYSDNMARLCVASTPDQLQRMQGMAQQTAELDGLLKGAVNTADRILQAKVG